MRATSAGVQRWQRQEEGLPQERQQEWQLEPQQGLSPEPCRRAQVPQQGPERCRPLQARRRASIGRQVDNRANNADLARVVTATPSHA